MRALQVLHGNSAEAVDAYRPGPFDLELQPSRPGIGHEALTLELDDALAGQIEACAAAEGAPTGLWTALAIESRRALTLVRDLTGLTEQEAADALDAAAAAIEDVPVVARGRRLVRYALALRGLTPRECGPTRSRLVLAVPHHTLVAWDSASATAQRSTPLWTISQLEWLPRGRPAWEAAAAMQGQTLAEWVVIQAARRSSR